MVKSSTGPPTNCPFSRVCSDDWNCTLPFSRKSVLCSLLAVTQRKANLGRGAVLRFCANTTAAGKRASLNMSLGRRHTSNTLHFAEISRREFLCVRVLNHEAGRMQARKPPSARCSTARLRKLIAFSSRESGRNRQGGLVTHIVGGARRFIGSSTALSCSICQELLNGSDDTSSESFAISTAIGWMSDPYMCVLSQLWVSLGDQSPGERFSSRSWAASSRFPDPHAGSTTYRSSGGISSTGRWSRILAASC